MNKPTAQRTEKKERCPQNVEDGKSMDLSN